jgi:hypothetical protein
MAERELVLWKSLCFILDKLGKIGKKTLMKHVIENVEPAQISAAKTRLMTDLENLKLTEKAPRIPARRDGDTRAENEVKDIFDVINFLDTTKRLNDLPRYVTDKPDNMPSIRMFDGDLGFILKRFEKLESRLDVLSEFLSALNVPHLDQQSWPNLPSLQPSTSANNHTARSHQAPTGLARSLTTSNGEKPPPGFTSLFTAGFPAAAAVAASPASVVDRNINNDQLFHNEGTNWAQITSTPDHQTSRAGTSSENRQEHEEQFTLVVSKKHGQKRSKPETTPHAANTTSQPSTNTRRRPLAVGHAAPRHDSPGHITLMAAPKKRIDSSVFYVDNIDQSHTADDIRKFVSSFSVRVLSCFEVKPRKRRFDYMPNRKAFRLCIFTSDRDKLIDENKWPQSVTISEWFFKRNQSETDEPRSRRSRTEFEMPSTRQRHEAMSSSADHAAVSTAAEYDDEQHSTVHSVSAHGSVTASTGTTSSAHSVEDDIHNDTAADVFMDADATIITQPENASDELLSSQIITDGAASIE